MADLLAILRPSLVFNFYFPFSSQPLFAMFRGSVAIITFYLFVLFAALANGAAVQEDKRGKSYLVWKPPNPILIPCIDLGGLC